MFQYHAAEHKAINAYEAGAALEPETVQRHSLIHVRCGTAFLLWVMVVAILVFSLLGKAAADVADRLARRALPLIAGLAYEVIRLAGTLRAQPPGARRARARPVAAAPDDAGADPRPGRGLDRARSSACCGRAERTRLGAARRGHGLSDGLPTTLRALQAPLKQQYREEPGAAVITLTAEGDIDDAGIACKVADRPRARHRGPASGHRRQRARGLLGRHAARGARRLRGRHAQGRRDRDRRRAPRRRTCAPRAISTSAARSASTARRPSASATSA